MPPQPQIMIHKNVVIIQSLELFFKLTTCLAPGMKKKTLKIRFENNKELEPGFLKKQFPRLGATARIPSTN
jgi:hypothetical protein